MSEYIVRFSATLHVPVEADSEDEARELASSIAQGQEAEYSYVAEQTEWMEPTIQINADDITSIEKEDE